MVFKIGFLLGSPTVELGLPFVYHLGHGAKDVPTLEFAVGARELAHRRPPEAPKKAPTSVHVHAQVVQVGADGHVTHKTPRITIDMLHAVCDLKDAGIVLPPK